MVDPECHVQDRLHEGQKKPWDGYGTGRCPANGWSARSELGADWGVMASLPCIHRGDAGEGTRVLLAMQKAVTHVIKFVEIDF